MAKKLLRGFQTTYWIGAGWCQVQMKIGGEWIGSGSILAQGAHRVNLSNLHVIPYSWLLLNSLAEWPRSISYRLNHFPFSLCITYTQWNHLLLSLYYYDLPDSMEPCSLTLAVFSRIMNTIFPCINSRVSYPQFLSKNTISISGW